jgi:hypothetical protein
MVGFSRHLPDGGLLANRRDRVQEATKRLFETSEPGTFTGQRNTKKDVQQRIALFDSMLTGVAEIV